MQLVPVHQVHYIDTEVTDHLHALQERLNANLLLRAKHDAALADVITEPHYKIMAETPTVTEVQKAIDFIRRLVQPAASVNDAKEARTVAQIKGGNLQNDMDYNDQVITKLKNEQKGSSSTWFRRNSSRILNIVAFIVAAADAVLAFGALRSVLPLFTALFASLLIGGLIFLSHFTNRWIMKAPSTKGKVIRTIFVLLAGAIVFGLIGWIRAHSAASEVSTDPYAPDAASNTANGWIVGGLSFVMFTAIVLFSLLCWRSNDEIIEDTLYSDRQKEIDKLEREKKVAEKKKDSLEQTALTHSQDARSRINFLMDSIKQAKRIGELELAEYKRQYVHFKGVVPPFFTKEFSHTYDESFAFSNPQNPQHEITP
ncbi:hypothetical protein [Sediminibacterium sp.]|uniref:hypothetical protein n=1 Tax=Sediminibacterium sp. TaxID=1917865 RepID=UPI003F6985EF